MRKRRLSKEQIGKGELILVNRRHPFRAGDRPDLVSCPLGMGEVLLSRQAAVMLGRLLSEADVGRKIRLAEGYRSREVQRDLYWESLKENGEEFTKTYVALPGCSEHETGLAVDVSLSEKAGGFGREAICPSFPDQGAGRQFRKRAAAYGFILRYPKGKEKITEIGEEPWHFRYVGYPHSCLMEERGLCLEEYHMLLRMTANREKPLIFFDGKHRISIWYEPWRETDPEIALEEGCACQISGDNEKGFFVTEWRRTV